MSVSATPEFEILIRSRRGLYDAAQDTLLLENEAVTGEINPR